jgi:hypothetical protein
MLTSLDQNMFIEESGVHSHLVGVTLEYQEFGDIKIRLGFRKRFVGVKGRKIFRVRL